MLSIQNQRVVLGVRPRLHQSTPRRAVLSIQAAAVTGRSQSVVNDCKKYIVQTYPRPDLVLSSGSGSYLHDLEGKRYLDFTTGIAVNALGHSDPRWVQSIVQQSSKLTHVSNVFHTEPAIELARRLVESSFADKAFFANSGTEANEGAIKFARKYAAVRQSLDPYNIEVIGPHEIVSFDSSFHGRTYGGLTLTGKEKLKSPFVPLVPGHHQGKFNDLDSAREVIQSGKTCAVFVEPVQGEGGVRVADHGFLKGLRELCDETGALLVFDEVQCGLGRSGKLWAYQWSGVEPDLMTLAKPLAGGLPIGVVLMTNTVAETINPGDHGSTFAGGALICEAANTVFDIINNSEFLDHVQEMSGYLKGKLEGILQDNLHVQEIRNCGLLFGIQLDQSVDKVVTEARNSGLLVLTAGNGNVVRLAPPLNTTQNEIDEATEILQTAFDVLK
eukprot:g8827.t1